MKIIHLQFDTLTSQPSNVELLCSVDESNESLIYIDGLSVYQWRFLPTQAVITSRDGRHNCSSWLVNELNIEVQESQDFSYYLDQYRKLNSEQELWEISPFSNILYHRGIRAWMHITPPSKEDTLDFKR